ncbi:hypothetical protein ACVW0Y_004262 [Pseudomonas sp. TE3786]
MSSLKNQRPGAMPILLNCLSLCFHFSLAGYAFYGAALLFSLPVNASEPASGGPPAVNPLDKEHDRQNKLRLQEKIRRELEENRRRILEPSNKGSEKDSPSPPAYPGNEGSRK